MKRLEVVRPAVFGYNEQMRHYLIGFKSCGKSTIGRLIAGDLQVPFIDLDDRVIEAYFSSTGHRLSFREIYLEVGETAFREMESLELTRLPEQSDLICSLGGGTVIDPGNQALIKSSGRVVLIHVDPDQLYERILRGGVPATFDHSHPRLSFEKLLRSRMPTYQALADVTVDVSGLTISQASLAVREEIAGHLPDRP